MTRKHSQKLINVQNITIIHVDYVDLYQIIVLQIFLFYPKIIPLYL